MLYVTTRSSRDAFTAPCTLRDERGADGGLYVPFRLPEFEADYLASLKEKSFGEAVAEVLNQFFACRLTGFDVDFTIGRSACRLVPVNRKIAVGEAWHNQQWNFDWTLRRLAAKVRGDGDDRKKPTPWLEMAIRIAILFGIYGDMLRKECMEPGQELDVAVAAGDFSAPMAAWFAKKMGLPVNTVVVACNENGGPWDLLYHSQLHTDGVSVTTDTPEGDHVVPPGLEWLISGALGCEEVARYTDICRRGRLYTISDEETEQLRQGLFAAVITGRRMESIISSVRQTHGYLLDPYAALAYGGLLDFRAKTGEVRPVLLMAEKSPLCAAPVVAKALGISVQQLRGQLHKN